MPYYNESFDQHSFNPYKMNSFADFEKLPFLTKRIVRDNIDKFIARGVDRSQLLKVKTGGSTGDPLVLYLCNKRRSADMAAKLRMLNWHGVGISDKRVRLRGIPAETYFKSRLNRWLIYLMNINVLNAFDMGQKSMERYIEVIKNYKPRVLIGYANAIYLLAKFIEKKGLKLNCSSLKFISAGAESLSVYQKQVIAKVFQCPVAISYGSMEGGSIAAECPRGSLHITSDNVFLELVKNDKKVSPGEEGEVVVTNLYNYTLPLIRYKQDDIAVFSDSDCPCGRSFPVLQGLKGRKTDFIILPGGKIINGIAFQNIIAETRGIGYFKLIQREIDKIQVIFEKSEDFIPGAIDEIKTKIDNLCEKKVMLDFILTDKIKNDQGCGKYKYIVSEIGDNYF